MLYILQSLISFIGGKDSVNYSPTIFLNELCDYRSQVTSSSKDKKSSGALSFGWLLQTCLLSDIPISSEFVTFLSELQDTYSPIKVNTGYNFTRILSDSASFQYGMVKMSCLIIVFG